MTAILLAVVLAAASFAPRGAQASALFRAPFLSFPGGPSACSIAVGDFDADGHPDLAVANRSAPQVSILPGSGDGTFGQRMEHSAVDYTSSVAIGDLNHDGALDVAAAAWYGGLVSILLGQGDGSYSPPARFATGPGRGSVTIADIDGDGEPDVLVSNQDTFHGNSVSVLRGRGDGTFAPRVDVPVGSGTGPSDVEVGDLNADGFLDLAVGATNGTFVQVLLGGAGGTFGDPAGFATGNLPSALALGDLNADGRLDLVAGGEPACVLLGNGDGTFGSRHFLGTSGGVPAIADLDEDGKPDVVITRGSVVMVMIGQGDGGFRSPASYPTGFEAVSLAVAELNGDGHLDVVTANEYSSTVSVLAGGGDGTLGAGSTSFPVGGGPVSVAVGDLNHDLLPDVVSADQGSTTASVLMGRAGGGFEPRTAISLTSYVVEVGLADLNRDDRPDLLVACGAGVSVLLGAGDGTFGPITDFPASDLPSSMAIGDVSGDGFHDVMTTNAGPYGSPGNTVSVLIGNGDGSFRPKVDYQTGVIPAVVAIADLDANGTRDLVVANTSSATVSVLLGNGDGTFAPRTDFPALQGPVALTVADINRDASPDIVLANSLGILSVMLGSGDGSLASGNAFSGPRYVHFLEAVDLDRDSRVDLVVASEFENGVRIMPGGDGDTFDPGWVYGTGVGPQAVAVGDLNLDDRPDLVVPNYYTNTVAVLLSLAQDPTPTLVSAARWEAGPNRVRLRWYSESLRPAEVVVFRTTESDAWDELGAPRLVGPNMLEYDDGTVIPGQRYGYRLAMHSPGRAILDEVWIDVPNEPAPATLWLRPILGPGRIVVVFQLPSDARATIDVWDVSGRRLLTRPVGSLGPGLHRVDLTDGTDIRPGVLLLRLSQTGTSAYAKACLTR